MTSKILLSEPVVEHVSEADADHPLPGRLVFMVLLSSIVLGLWVRLAFYPHRPLTFSLFVVVAASLFSCAVVSLSIVLTPRWVADPWQAVPLRRDLARCSMATFILLLFLPEYLARVQPPLLRSTLLLSIVTALWFLLSITCVRAAQGKRWSDKRIHQLAAIMMVSLFSLATAIAVRKYLVFGYVGQDLAYFSQIMHTTLEGHLFWGNLLQDLIYSRAVSTDFAGHNSPVMLIFLPFYAAFPSPITLIVLRNIVLISCAIPVFLIARRSVPVVSAWLWAAAFLLTPAILYQSTFDFYPLTFVALPLLFCLYYYLQQRYTPFCISLLATLVVREDLFLFALGLGLLAILQKRRLKWSLLPISAGIAWGALSFLVVLPAALHGATFVTDACFSHLGQTHAQMLWNVLLHPGKNVLVHGNLVYLKTLLTPTALVLCFGNAVGLLSLPFVAINLLAGAGPCITTVIQAQYSVVPATLLFTAALLNVTKPGRKGRIVQLAHLTLPEPAAAPLLLIALSCASLVFVTGKPQWLELREQPWNAEARHVLTLIPKGASVAAPRYMLPHLANRDCLFQTHRLTEYHTPNYEYLILDAQWNHINAADRYEQQYRQLLSSAAGNHGMEMLYSTPGYSILRNPAAAGKSCFPASAQAVPSHP